MVKKAYAISESEYDGNFIREVAPVFRGKRKDRMVELRCVVCGKLFTVSYNNSKRTRQKTCSNQCGGVLKRKVAELRADTHPVYTTWLSMRDRCNNPNNAAFPRYGGRGIKVDATFDSFVEYMRHVTSLPGYPFRGDGSRATNHTLDRVNPDGHYTKGNLRWTGSSTQAANKSFKKPYTTSKFIGVVYCKTNKAWIAKVQWEGKVHHVYYGDSEYEAVKARQAFIKEKGLPHFIVKNV